MFEIKVKKSNLMQTQSAAIKFVKSQQKSVNLALTNAREDSLQDIKMEVEALFGEYSGRHPEAENHGVEHFSFSKPTSMMGSTAIYGIGVEPTDEVGLFLMSGTDEHDIEGRDGGWLAYETTDGDWFYGPSVHHPGTEPHFDDIEEIVRDTYFRKVKQYLRFT